MARHVKQEATRHTRKARSSSSIPEPSPFETTMGDALELSDSTLLTRRELRELRERQKYGKSTKRKTALRGVTELIFTAALVVILYVVWQVGWTGILAAKNQAAEADKNNMTLVSDKKSQEVAPAQTGEPPVQPTYANTSDLIGQIYMPRAGKGWVRNIVQGTGLGQLDMHGYGHYAETQMPGEKGNFAIAGHVNGYGAPGGNNDKLQKGDALVVRTKDYWYVYKVTSNKYTTPNDIDVIAPVPNDPNAQPVDRYITLTTCWPKYTYPVQRLIVWGKFDYWAKVSDGVPKELLDDNGKVADTSFSMLPSNVISKIPNLDKVAIISIIVAVVLYIAAAAAWRWPDFRRRGTGSFYGMVWKTLPGVKQIRVFIFMALVVAAVAALFEWVYPWATSTIPFLQQMSGITVD